MTNKNSAPCVELRGVVKKFSGLVAVDHVDLKVEQGKVFSLLGPSGCGKTTTLRLVAGLEMLDGGDILIDGEVINDVPAYNRDCSTVFQTLALFPHMTVEGNIAYGLERRKVDKAEIKVRIGEMVELMGLGGMEKRHPAQLSGGQRQRVALARSLVLRPKILLLDEPLASLDRKLRKEMQVELKRIQREVGITFLYVTHDQKVALSISDIIAVMANGKLEQIGSARDIYETPKTKLIADFMGASNIFPGKARDKAGKNVEIETESGLKIIALKGKDKDGNSKEITGVSVHPELIGISHKGTDVKVGNKFEGKIVEMIYQGDFIETKVVIGRTGEQITANLGSEFGQETQFSPGEEVVVYWNPASSNILLG